MIWLITGAWAWTGIGATWHPDAQPIPWTLGEDLAGLDEEQAIAAVKAGFQVWEDADCGVAFEYQGRHALPYGSAPDGVNTLYLVTSDWPANPVLLSDQQIVVDGRHILEADIGLNAVDFVWAIDGDPDNGRFDLQGAVAHNVGHLLGLEHSEVPDATENTRQNGHPDGRTLAADDIEGLCSIYAPGAGEQGEPCRDPEECLPGSVCLDPITEPAYCAAPCDSSEACPEDTTCEAVEGTQVCVTAPPSCGCATPVSPPGWLLSLLLPLWFRRRQPPQEAP